MHFLERNRNLVFYALQILGWGFINGISFLFFKDFSTEFIVFNVIAGMLSGIIATTVFREFLRRRITFDNLNVKDFSFVFIGFLVIAAGYAFLNYGFGKLYHLMGFGLSDLEKKLLVQIDNTWLLVINSVFIIGIWTVCYFVIKLLLRLNKNRIERLELNSNLKQAQLNTLKGQINPHFMFNSLNNIRGLMLEDVEKSREMLTKLSEMLRYSLTKNSIDGIALEEELEMVDNYIALSKIQFEDRLEFKKEIAPDTLAIQIPPMIVQLLVENAAKHGIANLKAGGVIELITHKNEEALFIQVKNTGRLQIAKGSTQLGLKNINQRLKLLYGDKATFSLKEAQNEVIADVKIPLI